MTTRTVAALGSVMLAVGVMVRLRHASIGGAYLLAASIIGWWYSRACLKHLCYMRDFERTRAFVGDSIRLKVSIENRKPLPVIALRCEDEVPDKNSLGSLPVVSHYKPARAILQNDVYIGCFQRVEREFKFDCMSRGVFQFGPVSLRATDPMGMEEARVTLDTVDTLVVYPRLLALVGLDLPPRNPSGGTPDRGWTNPDPLEIIGIRPYFPGTPLNQVAWKATAKTSSLKAKMTLPSFQSQVIVALNLNTSEHVWDGIDKERLECAVCICASVCNELLCREIPFGFASNCPGKNARQHLFVAPGLSNQHLRAILDYLARVFMPWGQFGETLCEIAEKTPASTEILAIMPYPSLEDWVQLKRLQSHGYTTSVIVLKASPDHGEFYRSIPVYRPVNPVDWRSGEVIDFERLGPERASVFV
ncbi:MAG TPA: DUF58 domain-containing protein [Firmicutes bacterium]|nr:DUF58 domain-containing protein [Candidatus Fermentithermobacillaceae bacterium]